MNVKSKSLPLVCALFILVAACGGNEPSPPGTQPSPASDIAASVDAMSDEGSGTEAAGDAGAPATVSGTTDDGNVQERRDGQSSDREHPNCTGNDMDDAGLPIGPQCNVPPPPLGPGLMRATLVRVDFPDATYGSPVADCRVRVSGECSELEWEPVADVVAGEFVAIEISATNPRIMYAGVDSNDMTIYRSTDAGSSWHLVHVTGHNSGITISPLDPDIVLYTNLEAAIQLTLDGGETWQSVLGTNPDDGTALPFTAIAFSQDHPNIVYTTGLRSGDMRGGIWPAEPADVFRSTDSGETWRKVGTCETCSSVQTIVVQEGDPNTVWVAADGGLQVSTDGGGTWSGSLIGYIDQRARENIQELEPPQVVGVALQPGNPATILAASSNYGMFRSTDGGITWTRNNLGLTASKLHHVHFASSNPNVAYVTTHEGVFRSGDAGQSWTERSEGLAYKFVTPLAIDPNDEDVLYVGTATEVYTTHPRHKNRGMHDGEGLYKSTDGGKSWTRSDNGIYEAKISQMATHPTIPFNLWVGGESGRGNFFSPDGGDSWLFSPSITAHYPMVYAFSHDIPTVIYATGWLRSGELAASTDGGASWYTLAHKLDAGLSAETKRLGLRTDGATDFHMHGLAVAPSDSSIIYVGSVHDAVYPDLTFNLAGAHIFKSTDGGRTFPEMSNGFPIETKTSINAIVVHPRNPDIAYAMTTLHESETAIGVYKTTDGAKSWFPVNNGLDIFTNDLQIDPITPDVLYAATEGGVYKTTDGGQIWRKASTGLAEGPVIDLAIDPLNPLVLYAITPEDIYRTRDGAQHWYVAHAGLPLLEPSSAVLSAQERLLEQQRLDREKTGHSMYGETFGQDRTLEIDATGRIIVVAVKTHRNDDERKAERLLYRAVLTPLVDVDYDFMINDSIVEVTSQSNIYDMIFNRDGAELGFTAAGPTGAQSTTSLAVPKTLLQGQLAVFIDGQEVRSSIAGGRVSFEHILAGRTAVLIKAE